MKTTKKKRLLDPLVGRANLSEQSGPVAEQPPVGRAARRRAAIGGNAVALQQAPKGEQP